MESNKFFFRGSNGLFVVYTCGLHPNYEPTSPGMILPVLDRNGPQKNMTIGRKQGKIPSILFMPP